MKPTTRIIKQYINKGFITTEEMAFMLDCSTRRIQQILDMTEENRHFYDWEIQNLSEFFSDQGRNELASQFKSQKYGFIPVGTFKVDGSLLDENADCTKMRGKLLKLFEERKRDEGLEECDRLIALALQTKAEFRNLD